MDLVDASSASGRRAIERFFATRFAPALVWHVGRPWFRPVPTVPMALPAQPRDERPPRCGKRPLLGLAGREAVKY